VKNHEVQAQQDKPMVVEQIEPTKLKPIEPLNIYTKQMTRELKIITRQENMKSLIIQTV
jgi:hypothetical protein